MFLTNARHVSWKSHPSTKSVGYRINGINEDPRRKIKELLNNTTMLNISHGNAEMSLSAKVAMKKGHLLILP